MASSMQSNGTSVPSNDAATQPNGTAHDGGPPLASVRPDPSKPPVICVFCGASPGKSPAHVEAARALGRVFAARGIRLVYGGGTFGVMGELASTLVELAGPDSVHGVIPSPLIKYERRPAVLAAVGVNGAPETNGAAETDADEEAGEQANGKRKQAADADPAAEDGADDAGGRKKAEANGRGPPLSDVDAAHEARFGRTTVVPDMHARKALMARMVLAGGPGSGFAALTGGYGTLEELMEVTTWNVLGIHDRGVCVYNVAGYWDGLLAWARGAVDAGFVAEGNARIIVEAHSAEEVVEKLRAYEVAGGRFNLDWTQS